MFLKLRPHVQQSVAVRILNWLLTIMDPFKCLRRLGLSLTNSLLLESARIHPTFHVSLLKKAVGNYRVEKERPKGLASNVANSWKPVKVLATRTISKGGESMSQLLIQWKGRSLRMLLGRTGSQFAVNSLISDLRTSFFLYEGAMIGP